MKPALILALLLLSFTAQAQADIAKDETRAQALFREVRCVACQGQDIGDSDAPIAADMRNEIRHEITAGRSNADIRKSLYDHYGDYVLFRPRASRANLLLWGIPPLIILLGGALLFYLGRRPSQSRDYALSDAEKTRLAALIKTDDPAA